MGIKYVKNNKAGKKGFRVCLICSEPYPAVQIPNSVLYRHHEACISELLKLANQRLKVISEKEQRAERKKQKETIINWGKKLQFKVQEIVRLIDFQQPCLARDYMPKQFHGGHLFSRKGNENMKLNFHVIFSQSAQSNHFQNDDGLMRDGVVRVFGQEYLDFIISLKRTPLPKYTNEDVKNFYKLACTISNRMKKNLVMNSTADRIRLRNEINLELGYYPKEYCVFTSQPVPQEQ